MTPTQRLWLGRSVLVLGGSLIGLMIAELTARVMAPSGGEFVLEARIGSVPPDLYQPDPELRTRLRPSISVQHESLEYRTEIRTNALGIRGPEVNPKPPGEIRILTIGDSFTLGIQVAEEETAGSRLASQLSNTWGRTVTAWNAGVDGYGTDQATNLARQLALEVDADILLLRFYMGNDLRDNQLWAHPDQAAPPMELEGGLQTEDWNRMHRSLARWSRLYAHLLAWKTVHDQRSDPRIQEMADELRPYVDGERLVDLLPATQAALQRLDALCTELQIPCAVSWTPPAHVVHPERASATFDIFELDSEQSDPQRMLRTIQSVLPRGMISCDPGTALQRASKTQALYFVFDPHWNPTGHRIAGESDAACIASALDPDTF